MVKNNKLHEGSNDYRVKPQTGQFFTREDPFTLWYDLVDKTGEIVIKDLSPNKDYAENVAASYYPGKVVEKIKEDNNTQQIENGKQKAVSRLVVAALTTKILWLKKSTEEQMRKTVTDAIRVAFIKHGPLSSNESISEEDYKTGFNIKPSDDVTRKPVTNHQIGYNIKPSEDNIVRDLATSIQPDIKEFLQVYTKWLPANATNNWGQVAHFLIHSKYFDTAWSSVWPRISSAMKKTMESITAGNVKGKNMKISEDGEAMKTNSIIAIYKLPASVTVWAKPIWTLSNTSTSAASENQEQAIKAAQVILDDKDNGRPANRAVAVVQFDAGQDVPENVTNQEMSNLNTIKILGDSELSESEVFMRQLNGLRNLAGLNSGSIVSDIDETFDEPLDEVSPYGRRGEKKPSKEADAARKLHTMIKDIPAPRFTFKHISPIIDDIASKYGVKPGALTGAYTHLYGDFNFTPDDKRNSFDKIDNPQMFPDYKPIARGGRVAGKPLDEAGLYGRREKKQSKEADAARKLRTMISTIPEERFTFKHISPIVDDIASKYGISSGALTGAYTHLYGDFNFTPDDKYKSFDKIDNPQMFPDYKPIARGGRVAGKPVGEIPDNSAHVDDLADTSFKVNTIPYIPYSKQDPLDYDHHISNQDMDFLQRLSLKSPVLLYVRKELLKGAVIDQDMYKDIVRGAKWNREGFESFVKSLTAKQYTTITTMLYAEPYRSKLQIDPPEIKAEPKGTVKVVPPTFRVIDKESINAGANLFVKTLAFYSFPLVNDLMSRFRVSRRGAEDEIGGKLPVTIEFDHYLTRAFPDKKVGEFFDAAMKNQPFAQVPRDFRPNTKHMSVDILVAMINKFVSDYLILFRQAKIAVAQYFDKDRTERGWTKYWPKVEAVFLDRYSEMSLPEFFKILRDSKTSVGLDQTSGNRFNAAAVDKNPYAADIIGKTAKRRADIKANPDPVELATTALQKRDAAIQRRKNYNIRGVLDGVQTGRVDSFEGLKYIKATPNVHELREFVKSITDVTVEPTVIEEATLSKAMVITTRALQKNPITEASRVVLAVSKKMLESTDNAENLAEYIENVSGLDLHSYSKIFRESVNEEYSEKAHTWVNNRVNFLYPTHITNKGQAFNRALKEYRNKTTKK